MRLRVRELRELKGWNQTVLGYHAGLSPSEISLIETGKRNPGASTLLKLARALEVEVGDLFPKARALPSSDEAVEEQRGWGEDAARFVQEHGELLEVRDLTYVVSSKLFKRSVDRLTAVNEAIKAADRDEDFPLLERQDMQVAFNTLQKFCEQVSGKHRELFGDVDRNEQRRLRLVKSRAEDSASSEAG